MENFKTQAPIRTLLYRRGNWCWLRGSAQPKAAWRPRSGGSGTYSRGAQTRGAAWSSAARQRPLWACRGVPCGCTWLTAYACPSVRAQLECARSEAREALSTLRRLQRRVSELEEESRLQGADTSGASLQSELAHSLDSDQNQNADGHRDAPVSWNPTGHPSGRAADSTPLPFPTRFNTSLTHSFGEQTTLSPETQEASSQQPSSQEESLEPPIKRASLSPGEILEEKEMEVAQLQDEVGRGDSAGCRALLNVFLFSICNSEPFSTNAPLPG